MINIHLLKVMSQKIHKYYLQLRNTKYDFQFPDYLTQNIVDKLKVSYFLNRAQLQFVHLL